MELNNIVKEIKMNLTGDYVKDSNYLKEMIDVYKGHPLSKEVNKACKKLINNLPILSVKGLFSDILTKELKDINDLVNLMHELTNNGKYKKARQLLKEVIFEIENTHWYKNNKYEDYIYYFEPFEELIFRAILNESRNKQLTMIPISLFYAQYASLLVEDFANDLKTYDYTTKAMIWSPANAAIKNEYIEFIKDKTDLKTIFDMTTDAMKIAFNKEDVARCFCHFGYYFSELEMFKEALTCYTLSISYDFNQEEAYYEMDYILEEVDKDLLPYSEGELLTFSEEYKIPLHPDLNLSLLALKAAEVSMEAKDWELARYFYTIIYNLSDAEEFKDIIDTIPIYN